MKFYLHANTDQVYSALTNNAITSFANTIENLQHKTLSFMSDNFIFLSKTALPAALRQWKTDDVYFPVTLELDFSGIDVMPGLAVTIADGTPSVAESISNLKDAPEDMVGAFVCGEIPFAFVSAIIFENEENQVRFRKPSPDLWFPEELYKLADADCNEAAISIDDIATLSQKAEECLSEEDKAKVAALVSKRNRFKGLCYFAIRETGDWQNDNIKSNFDAYLVKTLDGKKGEDGVFFKAVSEKLLALKKAGHDVPEFSEIQETDEILLKADAKTSLDKKLLETVVRMYYGFGKDEISVSRDSVETIRQQVLAESDYGDGDAMFDVIAAFLQSSDMNPQKALAKLDGHPVCKALMKFLDSSDNDAFMRYGCEDLNQYERRYAYMMFGALKGMRFVEREQKSNIALEHRLEELAMQRFSSDLMISSVPAYASEHVTYGIDIRCAYWMGKNATLAVLSDAANLDKVKAVYELVAKDKAFKIEKMECFESPCTIFLCAGMDDAAAIQVEVNTVDELKKIIKDTKLVNAYIKKHPMSVQYDLFLKKYIQNDKWYSAVFDKYYLDIQQLCRN